MVKNNGRILNFNSLETTTAIFLEFFAHDSLGLQVLHRKSSALYAFVLVRNKINFSMCVFSKICERFSIYASNRLPSSRVKMFERLIKIRFDINMI